MSTTHLVRQGECIASIAARYGFFDWRAVYDAPGNAALRARRPDPHLLAPGDEVAIPQRTPAFVAAATERRHRFRVQRARTMLRLRVALPGAYRYELSVGAERFEGTTADGAPIEHPVAVDAEHGEIKLWPADAPADPAAPPTIAWALRIGHLDPVDEVSGVQGRLNNLGYYAGPIDGCAGPLLAAAVRAFQAAAGLAVTGEIDDALRARLRDGHDGG